MTRAACAVLCLLSIAPPAARAEDAVRSLLRISVAHPESVRVESPMGDYRFRARSRLVGTLRERRSRGLILAQRERDLAIPFAEIHRVEVSDGRHSRAGRGAAIGLLAGAVGGLAAGAIYCGGDCDTSGPGNLGTFVQVVLGIGGGLFGAGVGAIIGSTMHTERWREIPVETLHGRASPRAPERSRWSLTFRGGVDPPRDHPHTPARFAPELSPRVYLQLRRDV